MKRNLFMIVALSAMAVVSRAQQSAVPAVEATVLSPIALPGQAWSALGNVSPIEQNDVYSQSYCEQSATLWATSSGAITATPYASLGLMLDTSGHSWNNSIEPSAGVKFNRLFGKGIVSVGTAYTYQDRLHNMRSGALIFYAQDWFGWQPVSEKASRFPGNSWSIVGNVSPVEHGNLIAQGFISQGVVAKRLEAATLVVFAQATLSRDVQGLDWENKAIYGGGVKAVMPSGPVYSELGMAYLSERRLAPARTAGQVAVFMNVSFGWDLLRRKLGR
ncbi:MAG: hypothetical protein JO266_18455 [Acidobacteria bacterium]|nr:hypothetical protein [Acidobacteriota bacterium]MBV8893922.1 hypothetical protein [Acidobacteriota bacterium]